MVEMELAVWGIISSRPTTWAGVLQDPAVATLVPDLGERHHIVRAALIEVCRSRRWCMQPDATYGPNRSPGGVGRYRLTPLQAETLRVAQGQDRALTIVELWRAVLAAGAATPTHQSISRAVRALHKRGLLARAKTRRPGQRLRDTYIAWGGRSPTPNG